MGFRRQNTENYTRSRDIAISVVLAGLLAAFAIWLYGRGRDAKESDAVVIAVPYSELTEDYETNYYTRWLEEKAGYPLRFVYLDESYEKESLHLMLTAEHGSVDAVFFPLDQDILSYEQYQEYIKEGYLAAPQDHLSAESNLAAVQERYPEVDFEKLMGTEGSFFCFPSLTLARADRNMQIFWINKDWLTGLGLPMPTTAESLKETLLAFRDNDPNGNGLQDEIPLVSCEAENSLRSYLYLLNAFTYYNGEQLPPPEKRDAFREGLSYCAELYREGLLMSGAFPASSKQLTELVNDPSDTVGAFASHSISDVVYANNPDILAHFIQLSPLSSEVLEKGYAVSRDIEPGIGGILLENAEHKKEAAEIMDLMLSEEASLIALYGEKEADWRFSLAGELSTYGTHARVTTIHYIKGERQNKNYAGVGPALAASEFMDGVTWNGDHSMIEYIDARAVKAYEPHYLSSSEREQREKILQSKEPFVRKRISAYLETEIYRFITGERNAGDDRDWEDFLAEYEKLAKN